MGQWQLCYTHKTLTANGLCWSTCFLSTGTQQLLAANTSSKVCRPPLQSWQHAARSSWWGQAAIALTADLAPAKPHLVIGCCRLLLLLLRLLLLKLLLLLLFLLIVLLLLLLLPAWQLVYADCIVVFAIVATKSNKKVVLRCMPAAAAAANSTASINHAGAARATPSRLCLEPPCLIIS